MAFVKDGLLYKKTVDTEKDVQIGDEDDGIFIPSVKIKQWGGECVLKLKLDTADSGIDDFDTPEKVVWDSTNQKTEFFELADSSHTPQGALEFNLILKVKPADNVLKFKVKSQGVIFCQQKSMIEQIGTEGIVTATETEGFNATGDLIAKCDINVPGSFAVYADTAKINIQGKKKYRCGKVCHIFRPLITDFNGMTTYGELSFNDDYSVLKLKIPIGFFNSAVFPVIVDPTFGYTSAGVNEVLQTSGSNCVADVGASYLLSNGYNASITRYHDYGRNNHPHICIYDVSGGIPVNRITTIREVSKDGTNAWYQSNLFNERIPNGKTYCVATGEYDNTYRFYDSVGGNVRSAANSVTLDNPWSHLSFSGNVYSQYVTYQSSSTFIPIQRR
jgi:hypothetical protein